MFRLQTKLCGDGFERGRRHDKLSDRALRCCDALRRSLEDRCLSVDSNLIQRRLGGIAVDHKMRRSQAVMAGLATGQTP